MPMMTGIIGTTRAAEIMKVSRVRIRQLILDKRLPAQKIGRDYAIDSRDLQKVKFKPGGPPRQRPKIGVQDEDVPAYSPNHR